MRYEFLVNNIVIGWSELERGDPPMGVAEGVLHPTAAYRQMKAGCHVAVRAEGGEFLVPAGGVCIDDRSAELGIDGIEVHVLGLDWVTYERYFPHHMEAYEGQFPK
jgi:hypothetical protein